MRRTILQPLINKETTNKQFLLQRKMFTSDTSLEEKVTLEKLVDFCKRLQRSYQQIRTLTITERSNVDKTLAKVSRYELLLNSPAQTTPCYAEQQVEQIRIECLHEINNRLIASGELIHQMVNDNHDLLRSYRELEQAAQRLSWPGTGCSLIAGNAKRKPLEHYLQEGFRITYQLNGFVVRIKLVFSAVDVRQVNSIRKFRDGLKLPEELDLYLREFLAYAVFVG